LDFEMTVRLEHANLSVYDVDEAVRFLRTAFPEFKVRRDTTDSDGSRWVHVGTDETYIALNQAKGQRGAASKGAPLNHLAYEVDDVDSMRARLRAAGYKENTLVPNSHPYRKRLYFYDPEGNEWEFVQYWSGDPAKRHDYELPDR
jgi:catechol 2,3-dioxygenase-like lactoylglutathione lyase family enzyme